MHPLEKALQRLGWSGEEFLKRLNRRRPPVRTARGTRLGKRWLRGLFGWEFGPTYEVARAIEDELGGLVTVDVLRKTKRPTGFIRKRGRPQQSNPRPTRSQVA